MVTVFTAVGIVGGLLLLLCLISEISVALKWIFGVLIVVPLGWIICLTPLSLTIDAQGVVLKRVVGSLKIPASEIVEMRKVSPEEFKGAIRIAGSGGFCGLIGRFRNSRLGNFTLNITEQRNLIMVRTAKKKYIFNGRLSDNAD